MSVERLQTVVDLETTYGTLEDVPVSYRLHRYPAEPYPWGGSRGEETAIELVSVANLDVDVLQQTLGFSIADLTGQLEDRHDA